MEAEAGGEALEMIDRTRIWPVTVLASAAVAGLAVWWQFAPAFTAPAVLWFVLVCPGMALVHVLRLRDPVAELSLAVALSLALDTLVASAFLYAGRWSPDGTLTVLIAIAAVGAGADLIASGRWLREAPEAR